MLNRPAQSVDILTHPGPTRQEAVACVVGHNIRFSVEALHSFALRNFRPVVYDALLLAAAVEFCDRSLARRAYQWARRFDLVVPVHDVAQWSDPRVSEALVSALSLLTGDEWTILFVARQSNADDVVQPRLEFDFSSEAIIAYSDGMDSRAVAAIERKKRGAGLALVRMGPKDGRLSRAQRARRPFVGIPYEVNLGKGKNNAETSARSRGFKFAIISALAAHLVSASIAIIPESGQGALGPAWLPVGQGYPDYRNHPLFTVRMETFVTALLGDRLRYEFPRIWNTKSETLREYVDLEGAKAEWSTTRSCWQQQRQTGFDGDWRQCGVCAACILRRLSVHAADLVEPQSNYVWENLSSTTFAGGAHPHFPADRITGAMREYALAGVLHFDQLASLPKSGQYRLLKSREGNQLAQALGLSSEETSLRMDRLLEKHRQEWSAFSASWGETSFLEPWVFALS